MVDVSMGKEDEIDFFGIKQKRIVIESRYVLGSLEHSTVYQKFSRSRLDQITWSGNDFSCSAEG